MEEEKKPKRQVDLTGVTVYNQGWNAALDPEGLESGRFISTALEVLQTFLAKDESESAEVIALLDSTIQLLNTPPSAGLSVKAMAEFMRMGKRLVKKLNGGPRTPSAPAPVKDPKQQQIAFPVRKATVVAKPVAKDKEEQVPEPAAEQQEQEDEQPIVVVDDGEAKPMDTGMEEEPVDNADAKEVEEQEEEVEEEPAAAVAQEEDEEEDAPIYEEGGEDEAVVPVAKADDEESDTGGSDVDGEEAAEQAKEEVVEEEEELEGSAGAATKDKIPAARPDEEEELVDENPSPSVAAAASQGQKRARSGEGDEQEDPEEEDEDLVVAEPVAAPSPSKKLASAAPSAQKPQGQTPLIAAVIQNKRVHSVYESEAAARDGISKAFMPKAGQTIDNYCSFRPLPAHWKTVLSVKMAMEPVVENLPKIDNIALLWPDLAPVKK